MSISGRDLDTTHAHLPGITDEELLHRIGQGCSDCFQLLFHRYFRPVFSICCKILRDRTEAEDLLQEVFMAIFLQQERFDISRGSVRTWILQFAYFKSLRRRRYLRIREQHVLHEETESNRLQRSAQWEPLGMNYPEWARCVEEGISKLNEQQRRVIELIHVEGFTLQESASAMRQTMANTRNLYYRGMKSMRKFLEARAEKRLGDAKMVPEGLEAYRFEA